MNKSVWLKTILSIGGVLETLTGLGFLIAPTALTFFLLRSPLQGSGVVVAHVSGGALLSLGIACWFARNTVLATASIGVAWGFLVYNIVASTTLAWACPPLANGGIFALAAATIHGVLAVALLAALLSHQKSSQQP